MMKHLGTYLSRITSLSLGSLLPAVTLAQGTTAPSSGTGGLSVALKNPLAFNTLQEFIVAILDVIVIIATPIVVVFIVLAGFNYVTAQGNPSKIKDASNALMYAIIGGILILGAKAISLIIADLVTGFSK
jgi:formate-dependent nitrite reductase membrane component NrfD